MEGGEGLHRHEGRGREAGRAALLTHALGSQGRQSARKEHLRRERRQVLHPSQHQDRQGHGARVLRRHPPSHHRRDRADGHGLRSRQAAGAGRRVPVGGPPHVEGRSPRRLHPAQLPRRRRPTHGVRADGRSGVHLPHRAVRVDRHAVRLRHHHADAAQACAIGDSRPHDDVRGRHDRRVHGVGPRARQGPARPRPSAKGCWEARPSPTTSGPTARAWT